MNTIEKQIVTGSEDVKLPTIAAGPADAPGLLFIHGFAQSAQSWEPQFNSDLTNDYRLVAFDLRGQGDSTPKTGISYDKAQVWADDIEAVRTQMKLGKVVLVTWSFGLLPAADYLQVYGHQHVAGLVVIAGPTRLGPDLFSAEFGQLIPGHTSPDQTIFEQTNRAFAGLLSAKPFSAEEEAQIVATELKMTAEVRQAILASNLDKTEAFQKLQDLPTWVVWGKQDRVVSEKGGHMVADLVPGATYKTYDDAGHEVFRDAAGTFNADLRTFVSKLKF